MAGHRIVHALSLVLALSLGPSLLSACSSGGNSAVEAQPLELLALLPASTRGFVHLPAASLASIAPVAMPWRQHPADILSHYSGNGALLGNSAEVLLAQPDINGDRFVLLANVAAAGADQLFDSLAGATALEYRGYTLVAFAATDLLVVRLNRVSWAVGAQATLQDVVDAFADGGGLQDSAIAPYLAESADSDDIRFSYGLPALYGEVGTPGSGAHSLNRALAVRGSLSADGGGWQGQLEFFATNAEGYSQRLTELLPEGTAQVISAAGESLLVDVASMTSGDFLALFKSMVHGMNGVDYAEAVSHGGNPPWMNFDVGADPNSIFINFEFTDAAARAAFEAEHLPAGFVLAPLRVLALDEPRYFLVLNIYQSSGGLVEGARAEWSVFVEDPVTSEPRFLVIQAAAENISLDSVNGLTMPEPVSHVLEADAIVSYVGLVDEDTEQETTYFASRIDWPQPPSADVLFAREFVVANDYIFWGNAVADRGLYNGTVHARYGSLIGADAISLEDNSPWSDFIDPEPVHTVVYQNALEIVISPWWNLSEAYLDVTEAYRQELINTKNGFYPTTVLAIAEGAMQGQRPSLTTTMTGMADAVTTSFIHFTLRDANALLDYLGAGSRYTPVAVPYVGGTVAAPGAEPVYEDEAPRSYLTLALYQRDPDPCAARAEWQLVVAGPNDRPMTLIIESLSADACLDAEAILGLPALVRQEQAGDSGDDSRSWRTRVEAAFIRLDLQATWRSGISPWVLPSQAWIEAGDRTCSLGGVCNANFYDGMTLAQPLMHMGGTDVDVTALSTPFDDFIDPAPAAVSVRGEAAILGTNPWITVPVYGTHE